MKSLYIHVEDSEHARLKKLALEKGITLKDLVTGLLKKAK